MTGKIFYEYFFTLQLTSIDNYKLWVQHFLNLLSQTVKLFLSSSQSTVIEQFYNDKTQTMAEKRHFLTNSGPLTLTLLVKMKTPPEKP